MPKIITFSRYFPVYHPRRGEGTYFVEKIHWGVTPMIFKNWPCASDMIRDLNKHLPDDLVQDFIDDLDDEIDYSDAIKHHTIRAGHRWKEGDWFSPRVWSGKPYNSKQITIAPDMQVKKLWDFEMDACGVCSIAKQGEQQIYTFEYSEDMDDRIAANDGLTPEDFYWWFSRSPDYKKKKEFSGQILCWNENIEY